MSSSSPSSTGIPPAALGSSFNDSSSREIPTSMPRDAPNPTPRSGTLLRVLTHTQNASAAAFSLFMGIHLAAPMVAGLAGTGAADGVMLVGREYYLFLEPLAVYAPFGLHMLSSLARRALLIAKTGQWNPTTHQLLGYALVPLVIPHLLLHRIIPETDGPPINALSPSEMGYEFVGYACATRPWMTAGYVLLTGVALWHGLVGAMKVVGWAKRVLGRSPSELPPKTDKVEKVAKAGKAGKGTKTSRSPPFRALVTSITTIVCVGLVRLTADAQGISSFVASRYDAVFASAPWAALGLN